MNVLFVDELNILGSPIIPAEYLYMVSLDGTAFLNNPLVSVGKGFCEETLPLAIGKGVVVQKRELPSEVGNQTVLVVDGRGRKIFCVYGKNSSLIRNRYV